MGEECAVVFYQAGVAGYEEDEVGASSGGCGGGVVQVDGGGGGWGRHVVGRVRQTGSRWGR